MRRDWFRRQGARVRSVLKHAKVSGCGPWFHAAVANRVWGRTELDLSGRKSLDDHHRTSTVRTEPKWSRFLGRGGFWFGLRWRYHAE